LGEKDILIVPELSRLGRSMLDVMEVLKIASEKGIRVYAIKGEWELNNSIQSKVMAMVYSIASEVEKDLISSRTREALRARKAAGIKLGRPKGPGRSKLDVHKEEIIALLKTGSTKSYLSQKYKTSLPNFYNWLKKNKILIKPSFE
ncbi:resolvase, partial [bacterium]|nr:resolvase [bacterium]